MLGYYNSIVFVVAVVAMHFVFIIVVVAVKGQAVKGQAEESDGMNGMLPFSIPPDAVYGRPVLEPRRKTSLSISRGP